MSTDLQTVHAIYN